jgi:hypothetical protein
VKSSSHTGLGVHADVPTLGPGSTTEGRTPSRRAASRAIHRLLVFAVAAGLGVDAYVHWHLAPGFDGIQGVASPHISQGELFRLESILALIAILLVLSRHRLGLVVAFLIAVGGLGAVLFYGYVDIGGFGPVPDMYDPIWYPEKTISALAEAVAALGSLCLLWLPSLDSKADR